MSNVYNLLPSARRHGVSGQASLAALTGIVERIAGISQARMETKEDMQKAVLLLDLSNVHVRQLVAQISDQEVRARLMAHSERIGELVAIARRKVAAL